MKETSSFNTVVILILLSCGIVFFISSLFLYWWIHGDYERYLWIINGPEPYNNFGSGPFQLLLYGGLFTIGVLFFLATVVIWRRLHSRTL